MSVAVAAHLSTACAYQRHDFVHAEYVYRTACIEHIRDHIILTRSLTGSGAVYSFDPVGSYEREACRAAGAAQSLVQPFLDNQVSTRYSN